MELKAKITDFKKIITLPNILLVATLTGLYIFIGCPMKFLTGISCPGCGMTRAALNLCTLHFWEAFYYHPMVFTLPFFFYVFFTKKGLFGRHKTKTIVLIIGCMGFLAVYFYRLFFVGGPVVSVDTPRWLFWLQSAIQ